MFAPCAIIWRVVRVPITMSASFRYSTRDLDLTSGGAAG
jgi:hypothetical protein